MNKLWLLIPLLLLTWCFLSIFAQKRTTSAESAHNADEKLGMQFSIPEDPNAHFATFDPFERPGDKNPYRQVQKLHRNTNKGTGPIIRNRLLHIGFVIFEFSGLIPRRFHLGHLQPMLTSGTSDQMSL